MRGMYEEDLGLQPSQARRDGPVLEQVALVFPAEEAAVRGGQEGVELDDVHPLEQRPLHKNGGSV